MRFLKKLSDKIEMYGYFSEIYLFYNFVVTMDFFPGRYLFIFVSLHIYHTWALISENENVEKVQFNKGEWLNDNFLKLYRAHHPGPHLLTWLNFIPSLDK